MSSHDVFNRAGSYDQYVGRWSSQLAPVFISWLGVAPGAEWLDVGCGTGALTEAILAAGEPSRIAGIDPSETFISDATARIRDERVSLAVGSAMELGFEDHEFDAAVAALVLNFVPDPSRAVREMSRVVRRAGIVGAYVWDYAGDMRMMRVFWDAAVDLDPSAAPLDEGVRFTICNPDALRGVFEDAGLNSVAINPLDCEMTFADFDDYWNPFLGGQAPAPAYAMSLNELSRQRLRDLIRSRLPIAPDGTIRLVSRSWGVKGIVPGARTAVRPA
ncbi:MAG TPA: class I SAM-dependent methyltransferase [Candidatus Dormibacteraeota bacterium]|nr:class I SAM-dependent methyltransferase [Candidatus Dormibacteraeota bacterium]